MVQYQWSNTGVMTIQVLKETIHACDLGREPNQN